MPLLPNRGGIGLADLYPIRGHEHAGTRLVLIISTSPFNHGPAGFVCVLPLTRTDRRIPVHVPVDPPEGGVSARSYILCDAIRSIAKDRLGPHAWGNVSPVTLRNVEDILRSLMEL